MEASADIIFAFRGSSEWFAQPGLEEILFPDLTTLFSKKDSLIPHQGIRLSS